MKFVAALAECGFWPLTWLFFDFSACCAGMRAHGDSGARRGISGIFAFNYGPVARMSAFCGKRRRPSLKLEPWAGFEEAGAGSRFRSHDRIEDGGMRGIGRNDFCNIKEGTPQAGHRTFRRAS